MGWVKLHRETLEKAIWKCSTPEQKVIFVTIIMLANHKENQWIWKGKQFKCQPGQFITSIKSLANYGGVTIKNVRTALLKFEKLEFLASEQASDGRLITVLNWDRYQNNEDNTGKQPGKPLAKGWQTPGKGVATNKKEEKEKEFKEEVYKLQSPHRKEFIDYWTEWNKSGTKMRFELERTWDLKRRLERWASNSFGKKEEIKPKRKNTQNVERILNEDYTKYKRGETRNIGDLIDYLYEKDYT